MDTTHQVRQLMIGNDLSVSRVNGDPGFIIFNSFGQEYGLITVTLNEDGERIYHLVNKTDESQVSVLWNHPDYHIWHYDVKDVNGTGLSGWCR